MPAEGDPAAARRLRERLSALEDRGARLQQAVADLGTALDPVLEVDGAASTAEYDEVQASLARAVRRADRVHHELDRLGAQVDALRIRASRWATFSPRHWPARRDELRSQLLADPDHGVQVWWRAVIEASVAWQLPTLLRLCDPAMALPDDVAVAAEVVERMALALRDGRHDAARPGLAVVAAVADGRLPPRAAASPSPIPLVGPRPRARLHVIAARLALVSDALEAARAELELAQALDDELPEVGAAWAAVHRRSGDVAEARRAAESACSVPSLTIDAPVELVHLARQDGRAEDALTTAQRTISELPDLDDVDEQLGRLVEGAPPEVHLAAARRLLREESVDRARSHAEAASDAAQRVGAPQMEAAAATVLADLSRSDERIRAAAVERLVGVAMGRLSEQGYDDAIPLLEQAVDVDPDHVDAALLLAESWWIASWTAPVAESRPVLLRARDLWERAITRAEIDGTRSWALLTGAMIDAGLSAHVAQEDRGAAWEAVLLAARSVSWEPSSAFRWARLSAVLNQLGLFHVADAVSAIASATDPGEEVVIDARLASLANVGRFDELEGLLESVEASSWRDGVRALALIARGEHERAVAVLDGAVAAEPADPQLRDQRAHALLLCGRERDAERDLRWLWRNADRDDARMLAAAGVAALELGWVGEAVAVLTEAVQRPAFTRFENDAVAYRGVALLLHGQHEEGLGALDSAIEGMWTRREVDDVERQVLPRLPALAARHDTDLPDLAPLREKMQRRRAALAAPSDPATELDEAVQLEPEPVRATAEAAALTTLLHLRLAAGDGSGAEEALARLRVLDAEHAEVDRAATALLDEVVHAHLRRDEVDDAAHAVRRLRGYAAPDAAARAAADVAERLAADGAVEEAAALLVGDREGDADGTEAGAGWLAAGDLLHRHGRPAQAATAWTTAAAADDRLAAAAHVRAAVLLDHGEDGADETELAAALRAAAPDEVADAVLELVPESSQPVVRVLRRMAAESGPPASAARRALVHLRRRTPHEPVGQWPPRLQVDMPSSWFAHHEDPVTTHPLFTRHLPDRRAILQHRLGIPLPPVNVEDDPDLEPDGWRVRLHDLPVAQGDIRPGWWYAPAAAAAWLGEHAVPVDLGGVGRWTAVPDDRVPVEATGLCVDTVGAAATAVERLAAGRPDVVLDEAVVEGWLQRHGLASVEVDRRELVAAARQLLAEGVSLDEPEVVTALTATGSRRARRVADASRRSAARSAGEDTRAAAAGGVRGRVRRLAERVVTEGRGWLAALERPEPWEVVATARLRVAARLPGMGPDTTRRALPKRLATGARDLLTTVDGRPSLAVDGAALLAVADAAQRSGVALVVDGRALREAFATSVWSLGLRTPVLSQEEVDEAGAPVSGVLDVPETVTFSPGGGVDASAAARMRDGGGAALIDAPLQRAAALALGGQPEAAARVYESLASDGEPRGWHAAGLAWQRSGDHEAAVAAFDAALAHEENPVDDVEVRRARALSLLVTGQAAPGDPAAAEAGPGTAEDDGKAAPGWQRLTAGRWP